jgi:hypothetical protein
MLLCDQEIELIRQWFAEASVQCCHLVVGIIHEIFVLIPAKAKDKPKKSAMYGLFT